ncbi:cadherin domain-containing protein [Roseibacillus ishigakijimensis]|uniref:PQQ-dependent sugar dehydrogenase n=1 Tax=Roseibacillus ishigakijimensis TaxID=454146 RepID=A0A934RP95_9BACT|nr:cadherin domain-containing protein [Roseibacillus ishigakijimensis]MBK1834458.1 PQQ-dependent sugar dehydrogenase [Roseibacillus ishigakijimensis]
MNRSLSAFALSTLLALPTQAQWQELDTFESNDTPGNSIDGQNGWSSDFPDEAVTALDPADSGRGTTLLLRRGSVNGATTRRALDTLEIPEGQTGTLFFELFIADNGINPNLNLGLSDRFFPTEYGDFEAQFRVEQHNISPRSGGGFIDSSYNALDAAWMKVWMVVDNEIDRTDFYVESPVGESGLVLVASGHNFRNGTSDPLRTLQVMQGAGRDFYLDNIYLSTGENLSDPTAQPAEAEDDAITVAITGSLAFDPLANDSHNPTAVTVASQPTQGSASWDAERGVLIYKHSGSSAGSDSFTYTASNAVGASTATVSVTIAEASRLAAETVAVPLTPPAVPAGALVIEEALPGEQFPGAVALAPVPGSPESLLIASVTGKIWLIADTTEESPEPLEVLDLSGLSNFVNSRSIYSVACFPDFATTGHIVVNYQGDKGRLPLPLDDIPHLDKNGVTQSGNSITCDLRVSRFTLSPAHLAACQDGLSNSENTAALLTELPYLNLAEQHNFHSINDAKFGPDGYLYVSFGDEGDQGSPYRNTQTITKDQYSALIRIDVDPSSTHPKPNPHYAIAVGGINYAGPADPGNNELPNTPFTDAATQEPNFRVPADNPFVSPGKGGSWDGFFNGRDHQAQLDQVRDEIWAVGMRNPFKFSIESEPGTGETMVLYGDIGKDDREEFTAIKSGGNGGWAYYEGDIITPGLSAGNTPEAPAGTTPHTAPFFSYPHSLGNSATGGMIYRGSKLTEFVDRYLCADFGSGRIWSMNPDGSARVEHSALRQGGNKIVAFQTDEATGDVFVLENNTWSGGNSRLLRITYEGGEQEDYPQALAELGLFADLSDFSPNPGVLPYQPILKFWSDGADKSRWFTLPDPADSMEFSTDGPWQFPVGTIWVKHFNFDLDRENPGTSVKRLETRVLVQNEDGGYGVSYQWNEDDTTATLVPTEGVDFDLTFQDKNGESHTQSWRIPSRAECMTCHNATAGVGLSFNTRQLNHDGTLQGESGNFLTLLAQSGYLGNFPGNPESLPHHFRPDEETIDLEARVRSYLDVNCAYCHQPGGGVPPGSWDGRAHLSLPETGLLYGQPVSEGTAHPEHVFVRPGDKDHSVLWNRLNARTATNGNYNGESQMPPLATNVPDPEGLALLAEWIDHHANTAPVLPESLTVPENSPLGHILSSTLASDADLRAGVSDQSQLSYQITGGNEAGFFHLDPSTGAVTVTGWLDFEATPTYLLQVTAHDNFAGNPLSTSGTVRIELSDEDPEDHNDNGLPDPWESAFALADGAATIDSDGDGVNNFFEWLTGSDPTSASDPGPTYLTIAPHEDDGHHFTWQVLNGLQAGVHYQVQSGNNLQGWETLTAGEDYEVVSQVSTAPGKVSLTIRLLAAPGDRHFLRLSSE